VPLTTNGPVTFLPTHGLTLTAGGGPSADAAAAAAGLAAAGVALAGAALAGVALAGAALAAAVPEAASSSAVPASRQRMPRRPRAWTSRVIVVMLSASVQHRCAVVGSSNQRQAGTSSARMMHECRMRPTGQH